MRTCVIEVYNQWPAYGPQEQTTKQLIDGGEARLIAQMCFSMGAHLQIMCPLSHFMSNKQTPTAVGQKLSMNTVAVP